jgi:hypothetical protein
VRSSFALVCSALFAALALASCGGSDDGITDSGPSAEAEVRAAAAEIVAADDPKVFCKQLISEHLVDLVYEGDVGNCLASDDSVPEEPGKAHVFTVVVDPKTERGAEVKLRVDGGDEDGSAGHISMVKEKGDWKLDDYGDDFLRSAILAEIETVDEGAAANPKMKACFSRQFRVMPAAKIRQLSFTSNDGHQNEVNAELLKLAEKCPKALADYGAETFSEALVGSKFSPAFVKCFRQELFFFFELTELAPALLVPKPDEFALAELEGIATGAKKNCLEQTS